MTAVAFLQNHGQVVFIGDLMVSRSGEAEEPIRSPTAPDGRTISGVADAKLRRKLYIINDLLAVGVAGELTAVGAFVAALKRAFASSAATHEDVAKFVNAYPMPAEPLQALFVCAEPDHFGPGTVDHRIGLLGTAGDSRHTPLLAKRLR
jgi:hypothetical protein